MISSLNIARAVHCLDLAARERSSGGDLPMLFPGERMPKIALSSLEAGYDSPALIDLAGLDSPTWTDAAPILRAALDELGLPANLTPEEALLEVQIDLARKISQKETNFEAVEEAWTFLNDHWEDLKEPTFGLLPLARIFNDPDADSATVARAREEAEAFLHRNTNAANETLDAKT